MSKGERRWVVSWIVWMGLAIFFGWRALSESDPVLSAMWAWWAIFSACVARISVPEPMEMTHDETKE